ncbi:hypothetical protein HDV04_000945 [Boothiomyces sp. JEL0838]|nr:hypothetical protein HDV04_000896 [Boothiomyces sp. JEL0838]KAJ3314222.1 hypothetical protein HDV04_000945 [Boothiomyces sp. JEL0838]
MVFYIGVDVGTSSARAAIFDQDGKFYGMGINQIKIRNPRTDYYEQSSGEVWSSVCTCINAAIKSANIDPLLINGIGFDATCSLVNLGCDFQSIQASDDPEYNITMWMDHRSHVEASLLSKSGNSLLKYTGGSISPEMSIAKVLWMYKNNADYHKIKYFIELPEYLTLKASNSTKRALCSLVCKWGYSASAGNGWNKEFLSSIVKESDFADLFDKFGGFQDGKPDFSRPGEFVGNLTKQAALEFGYPQLEGISVGGAAIDAYAGAIATLASVQKDFNNMESKMAIICGIQCITVGTSSCFITMTKNENFTSGVWGPYKDVIHEGYYSMEGGQTLTGKAIEVFLSHHPSFSSFKAYCKENGKNEFEELNNAVMSNSASLQFTAELVSDIHILPDCHGNRSPIANQTIRGMLMGISLIEEGYLPLSLVKYYYATILSLCYSSRHIIESLKLPISDLYLSGGLSKNSLWCQSLADVTGCNIYLPAVDPDATVLLGAAMCGAAASTGMLNAMTQMSKVGGEIKPNLKTKEFHNLKYEIFLEMYEFEDHVRRKMEKLK